MPEAKFNSASGEQHGVTIMLDSEPAKTERIYQDTPLPFADSHYRPAKEALPERLREMRRLYQYGRESINEKAKSFYRQGLYMQDFEDDAPWTGDFSCYFPTYQDLNTKQLRGYFTWRAGARRGNYQPIATSAAYIYVYELLNGIGCASPEESIRKLLDFEHGFLDSGIGDAGMRRNLRRWMLEFAVLYALPPETAQKCADPELLKRDKALVILKNAKEHSDEDVFSALCFFGGSKTELSPVLAAGEERGRHLFSDVWREASDYTAINGKKLFTVCFGIQKKQRWYPLANAVYYQRGRFKDASYQLDDCRSFICSHGMWQTKAYEKVNFDLYPFRSLLHEAEAKLRRYLKTGRYLREKPEDLWAAPYIDKVIEEDRKAVLEAARPKVTIDLSGLEQIRKDASVTRDSLLTEEELFIEEFEETPHSAESSTRIPADIPLDAVQTQILHLLLLGESAKALIEAQHLTPSLAADQINEVLYDEIGDIVLSCEDDELVLVEDYREDIERLFGEMQT